MRKNIFISFAQSDRALVQRLILALRTAEVGETGVDGVAIGQDLTQGLRSALEHSSAVVVLLSPRAVTNPAVNFEIGAADALGKPLIPVIMEGENLDIPDILKERRLLDARGKTSAEVASDITKMLEEGRT